MRPHTDPLQTDDLAAAARKTPARVLLVEDSGVLAATYKAFLRDEAIELTHAATGAEALAALRAAAYDVLLLDLHLPDMNGMDILRQMAARKEAPATVVLTADGSISAAVEAMRLNAIDFIEKPVDAQLLIRKLNDALDGFRARQAVNDIRRARRREGFSGFVGASPAMQDVYRIIEQVAPSRASVFITGESGTGKDVAARAIHDRSPRAQAPFIALNCGAIPKDLMESEIFGHVKGAYSGAVADRPGAARRADGGTLFLDELGEMDLRLQTKLLRFVQTGEVTPVGCNTPHKVDVRILCATNRNPREAVAQGRLREDLYYRLHVVPLHLPPLRERGEDILRIARSQLNRATEEEGKSFTGFAPETERLLLTHRWPGNVRELINMITRIAVLHDGPVVTPGMVAELLPAAQPAHPPAHLPAAAEPSFAGEASPEGGIKPLWVVERDAIEEALARCDGNITLAAACLGINPSTIYRKRQSWRKLTQAAE